jgi:CRISPR-associated exonuclease Cas4
VGSAQEGLAAATPAATAALGETQNYVVRGTPRVAGLDLVAELFNYFRAERAKHQREPGVVWVTDLVSCSLKSRYSEVYPELEMPQLFNPVAVHGTLVHRGLESLLAEILAGRGAEVRLEQEASAEVDLSQVSPGAGKVVVKGRIDALVLLGGERVGVEIKSMRGDAPLPLEHHVDQVRLYNLLFDLPATILLYVTPERVAQYEVRERADWREVAQRILEPKAPRYPWECRYCPFAVVCPSKHVR